MATKSLTKASPTEEPAARKKRTDTIERSAHRMHRLLEDLLDIASIEAGHLAVEVQRHLVAPLVREAVELRSGGAGEQLRLQGVLPDQELDVNCDRGQVLQVFGNLIGNAIKFTGKGGSITVTATPLDEETLFSVADSGPGIEAAELSHVFNRFWQARKTARLGTGIGLAIAKALVEAHGGQSGSRATMARRSLSRSSRSRPAFGRCEAVRGMAPARWRRDRNGLQIRAFADLVRHACHENSGTS